MSLRSISFILCHRAEEVAGIDPSLWFLMVWPSLSITFKDSPYLLLVEMVKGVPRDDRRSGEQDIIALVFEWH